MSSTPRRSGSEENNASGSRHDDDFFGTPQEVAALPEIRPTGGAGPAGMSAALQYFAVPPPGPADANTSNSNDNDVLGGRGGGAVSLSSKPPLDTSPVDGRRVSAGAYSADSHEMVEVPPLRDAGPFAPFAPFPTTATATAAAASAAEGAEGLGGGALYSKKEEEEEEEEEGVEAFGGEQPSAGDYAAEDIQEARMRAYDAMCGTPTVAFLRETAAAFVPDAVNAIVGGGAETAVKTSEGLVPEGVRRAAGAFGSAANSASRTIVTLPQMLLAVVPESVLPNHARVLFGDFTNTLRSFYHTNVLSMPFVVNQAGLIGGLLLLTVVAFTSAYATEAFFGAKNQLRTARTVVTYGDVPFRTWGRWYPSLNLFYGITHLIGFIAFSAANTRVLLAAMGLTGGGATALSLIVPSLISLPLVFIKRDVDQRPYAVISSFIVFVSVVCMFAYFPYSATADVKLWADSAGDFFVALGVTVYAFTGIGSCTPIERTMPPRRYVACLRAAMLVSCSILLAFGLSGFLSYGPRTCSVITVSLQPGPMRTAVSALLFVASISIIPQQTFPLCELCDRRVLGIHHVPGYWELRPNLLRVAALVVSALAAWIVPYYGLLLSISGAVGCGIVGIVVPAALDYVRRARWGLREGRHLRWWEYIIVFGLGTYGCAVVVIGVTFGMYKMWVTIQTNAADAC